MHRPGIATVRAAAVARTLKPPPLDKSDGVERRHRMGRVPGSEIRRREDVAAILT